MPGTPPTRAALVVLAALSVIAFVLHAAIVRPHNAPAGAGVSLSDAALLGALAPLGGIGVVRPPAIVANVGAPIVVSAVQPDGPAARAGVTPGLQVELLRVGTRTIERSDKTPLVVDAELRIWRDAYWAGPRVAVMLRLTQPDRGQAAREVTLAREPVWASSPATQTAWLRRHAGALAQMAAFIGGALALLALRTRGITAALMTLALLASGVANGGPLVGAESMLGPLRAVMVLFVWTSMPVAFLAVGLAILHFPRRADILTRHRWIPWALAVVVAPMMVTELAAALFLLGGDVALPLLSWLAARGRIFDASFALALAAVVAIVVEGIGRYQRNPDATERRRIQIVVLTGVPAVLAFAALAAPALISSWSGSSLEWPWAISALLEGTVLLPAFGLPYAVAVRQVFSPRTVIRRSLQYAFARRSLSVLFALPAAMLALALLRQRDRAIAEIVLGQPLFYLVSLGLVGLAFRYRDTAQRWLDRRFFRAEYDAREIMISLATRVPYETDPQELVALVITQIDHALHPETVAVLAGEGDRLDVVSTLRADSPSLPLGGGLATLLRWSDQPFDVALGDERSPAARLPEPDRRWLTESNAALVVPILATDGESRSLIGVLALGPKRSEEPYTAEDRQLLRTIAGQMSLALNLSRLRQRVARPGVSAAGPEGPGVVAAATTAGITATPGAPIGVCPACCRVFELSATSCEADGAPLELLPGLPRLVDGKYRLEALIGRGGMGAVLRARDVRLERDVALKVVRADLVAAPEARARFRREAQMIARLQHPAVVTVYDYGTLPDGAAFLVMEYVRGEDLRHLLQRERRLEPSRVVTLVAGIAAGVDAAHAAGVLHRDLKPENVILPESGAGPKVLDFGVAKIGGSSGETGATQAWGGTIVGTPAYMPPEQLRGEPVDARADVFSLGVMTYEALTGRLPYGAGSFLEIGLKQAAGAAAVSADGLPPTLAPAVLAALAVDRNQRPSSPTAFAAALELGQSAAERP
jgi:GAF domain-containing protein